MFSSKCWQESDKPFLKDQIETAGQEWSLRRLWVLPFNRTRGFDSMPEISPSFPQLMCANIDTLFDVFFFKTVDLWRIWGTNPRQVQIKQKAAENWQLAGLQPQEIFPFRAWCACRIWHISMAEVGLWRSHHCPKGVWVQKAVSAEPFDTRDVKSYHAQ